MFSDASSTGYGGFVSGAKYTACSGNWTEAEARESSTWRELQAVQKILPRLISSLERKSVRWNTDNKNVVTILTGGSMKPSLQYIAVQIFNYLIDHDIIIFPEWIPRQLNVRADLLSRQPYYDSDDWQISDVMFSILDNAWGPFTVDRFATDFNAKCVHFNSKTWSERTETVDSLTVNWAGEMNWVVPPLQLSEKCALKRQMGL